MRDDDDRLIFDQACDRALQNRLILGIDICCRLIEHDDRRVL